MASVFGEDSSNCKIFSTNEEDKGTYCFYKCISKTKYIIIKNQEKCPIEIMFEGSGRISDKKIKIIPKFNFGYSSSGGSHFGINLNFKNN